LFCEELEGSLKLLHVIPDLAPQTGGPVTAVMGLAKAQAAIGHEVCIASSNYGLDFTPILDDVEFKLFPCQYDTWRWAPELGRYLQTFVKAFDVVMIESLWQYPTFIAGRTCRAAKMPYVVSPNGMLDEWSLSQKAWKKKPYLALIERSTLSGAAAIHLTSDGELNHSHLKKWRVPKLVVPLGFDKSNYANLPSYDRFFIRYPELSNRRIVLFLGRLHYKKQPDVLIRAFHKICRDVDDLHLVLAGSGERVYVEELGELVKSLGIEDRVLFTGILKDEAVKEAYTAASIFVLPSWQENFGLAVVEALAAECPVVVSDHMDLAPDILRGKCGLVVVPNVDETATAMVSLLSNDTLRREMGRKGRKLVLEKFTWENCAQELTVAFEDILSGRKQSCAWR
jgi:glycosyltransferase involved in cell wall biosynthesis